MRWPTSSAAPWTPPNTSNSLEMRTYRGFIKSHEPPASWARRWWIRTWSRARPVGRFLLSARFIVVTLAVGTVAIGTYASVIYWDDLSSDNESISASIRNIAVVLGGFIALVLSIWRSYVADLQAHAARKQSEIAQKGLLNERYQKGAEMLGSGVLSVRLGGIYALNRLAKEHPSEYHVQIMELFCAFVRNPAKKESEIEIRRREKDRHVPDLGVDVAEVMTAIGQRSEDGIAEEGKAEGFELNFRRADLRRLSLLGGNLRGADFTGAYLMHSHFADTDLRGANCSHGHLYMAHFLICNLTDVNLSWSDLSGATLFTSVFDNTELTKTEIGTGEEISPTDPSGYISCFARLTQAQLDAAKADEGSPPAIAPGTPDAENGQPLVWRGGTSDQAG